MTYLTDISLLDGADLLPRVQVHVLLPLPRHRRLRRGTLLLPGPRGGVQLPGEKLYKMDFGFNLFTKKIVRSGHRCA